MGCGGGGLPPLAGAAAAASTRKRCGQRGPDAPSACATSGKGLREARRTPWPDPGDPPDDVSPGSEASGFSSALSTSDVCMQPHPHGGHLLSLRNHPAPGGADRLALGQRDSTHTTSFQIMSGKYEGMQIDGRWEV